MSKSAMVRARLEPGLKRHVETVFHRLGLNATQAVTIFYKQVEIHGGLPFNVAVPAAKTERTFTSTDEGHELIMCKDVDDMFKKLGI
jgi:DNA-damage-inducible protein J